MALLAPYTSDPFPGDRYTSPVLAKTTLATRFPSATLYWNLFKAVVHGMCVAHTKAGYTDETWVRGSLFVLHTMERVGAQITIDGLEHLKNIDGPCVFICNHMSAMETFVLPGIVQPYCPFAVVVKESLLHYPLFKHIMRARNPIAVGRKNPRDDLKTMLSEGKKRLESGLSVLVFPQSTRSLHLEAQNFNSIGVKLAKRSNVPVVPLAMATHAWGMGTGGLFKDFGAIRPDIPINFCFGAPLTIAADSNGKEEQAQVFSFIEEKLTMWIPRDEAVK